MAIMGEWIRRVGYLLRRGAREDELRREMEAHRAQMGAPPAFGNTLRLREDARDVWGWRWLDDLVHDTRFAWRTLRRSRGFTVTAIVTLALGIGVNTGMFSFVNGLLVRPLYDDEVVLVNAEREYTYATYRDVHDGTANVFAHLAAVGSPDFLGLDAGDGARNALVHIVSASYFQVFGAPPVHGRAFTTEEESPGAGIRVAIISYPLWEQLGADASVLGRLIRINGDQFTIVGVAREGFQGLSIPGPEVWLPLGARETGFTLVGRLRPGTPLAAAETAVDTVGRRLDQAFPGDTPYSLDIDQPGNRLMFMPGARRGMLSGLALLLMLMPVVVLLVACLNLADLLLARGHMRRQELAVRSSLGGGRWRLVRQLLTEGLLLAVAGAAIGLWLSTWAIKSLLASVRPLLPVAVTLADVTIDWRVLLGTVAFSLFATLIFGAGPALAMTRRAAATDLKRQAGDEGPRPGGVRIGNALAVAQIALSLLLLASGGLFMMSAIGAAGADPGFPLDGGLVVQVDPGLAGYDEAQGRQVHLALIERLRAVPGVEAVSIGSRPPFTSIGDSRDIVPAGAPVPQSDIPGAAFSVIGRDYARTLGLSMLRGRDFTDAELTPGPGERVAIVSDTLAEALWPGQDALGRLMQFIDVDDGKRSAENPPLRVVGIMPSVNASFSDPRPSKRVYVPLGQHYESAMTLQIRLAGKGAERAMVGTIARIVRDVDERLPVLRVATWRDHFDADVEASLYRVGAGVFSAFAGIALLLAVVGVYGVKSYVVSRRTREFGIRIAIGAQPRALLWQVVREGGRITAIGIGIGLLLAVGAGQFLQGILYGVNSVEPVVLVTAPLILIVSALLASYVPALRAASVDPTVALRSE